MTKQEIINRALANVEKRRINAVDRCEQTLATLRKDARWKQNETELRVATVQTVMAQSNEQKNVAEAKKAKCIAEQKKLLELSGLTEADLKPHFSCKHCDDSGFVNNLPCECLEREIRAILTKESDVVNPLFTFDSSTETNTHNKSVYRQAEKLCETPSTNMLLLGNTGSGKTYLLTACVNKCVKLGKTALFTTAYGLNASFLECHLSDARTRQLITDSLVGLDVLAIDDFGTEQTYKNVTAEYLFIILNERLARGKQTFISTNLSLSELRDRYDERIFSRLLDKKITFIAEMQGEDKRIRL